MPDTYASIRAEIEAKIERARKQPSRHDIACSVTDGEKIDVMCTPGTQYIVICDCINDPPPPDFIAFTNANQIAVRCMDSLEGQKIIEYLGLDMDSDVCPLIYDIYTETALVIGQTYDSVKWRLGNDYAR